MSTTTSRPPGKENAAARRGSGWSWWSDAQRITGRDDAGLVLNRLRLLDPVGHRPHRRIIDEFGLVDRALYRGADDVPHLVPADIRKNEAHHAFLALAVTEDIDRHALNQFLKIVGV